MERAEVGGALGRVVSSKPLTLEFLVCVLVSNSPCVYLTCMLRLVVRCSFVLKTCRSNLSATSGLQSCGS